MINTHLLCSKAQAVYYTNLKTSVWYSSWHIAGSMFYLSICFSAIKLFNISSFMSLWWIFMDFYQEIFYFLLHIRCLILISFQLIFLRFLCFCLKLMNVTLVFWKMSLIYIFKIKCFIVKYWECKNIIFKNPSKFYFLLECQTKINYLIIICNINEQEITLPDLKEIKYFLQLLTSM